MLCDRCKKNNATVHITKINNGVMNEEHLCPACAQASGQLFNAKPEIGWQNLFGGFAQPVQTQRCSVCGRSYADFAKSGKMGCPQCYREFALQLPPLLQRIQGGLQHRGKAPLGSLQQQAEAAIEGDANQEIARLKKELSQLVAEERFEEAAQLRDKIKAAEAGEKHA